MKWLLVTTIGVNPGDDFVRVGVERLIRAADPRADIELINKHSRATRNPVEFNRAVVCGMPMFWCHNEHRFWIEPWWGALTGWLTKAPDKLLVAGGGSFCPWPDRPMVCDATSTRDFARLLWDRCCGNVYARDGMVPVITDLPEMEVLPCPSIFAVKGHKPLMPGAKLCNIMPDGSHYREYGPDEAAAWDRVKWRVAAELLHAGYLFVAHNDAEAEFAERVGWRDNRMYVDSGDPRRLLSVYAGASEYIGNRVHGAIVSRAAGAQVSCIGYDSRQEAVRLVGGTTTTPRCVEENGVPYPGEQSPVDIEAEWNTQLEIFKGFAG